MHTRKSQPYPHEIVLRPVGVIRNAIAEPFLVAGEEGLAMRGELATTMTQVRTSREELSRIIIDEEWGDVLDGIEEYSHITVLYWAHRVPDQGRRLSRVHPMGRKDYPLVGIYSTCSPARPNPVLMTVVSLRRRCGNVVEVAGIDAVDGSPVIDIKPYVADFYPREEVRIPAWMQRIQQETREGAGKA
ncbi:MAG TPA: tRNA (N6-threonylcarbamoyladenosine(37)-N6)-methyltransferase TrmO [Methanoculleus sp.]|nr:tRNA (N6-threonylcarbamoyladenosine(37)-N6)-methyltransferase TrmO [Methanoculleus sp.]